jgi:hypothetical protein
MIGLLILMSLVAVGSGVVGWHHFDRFAEKGHRLSVVAGLQPLGWLFACALLLEPCVAHWRPLVLAPALLASTVGALMVYGTRKSERRLTKAKRGRP